ncbi:hypothetical protein UA08_03300 [Talaromyces atroroseus]|uniref:F-actin-capping protein subunit alpha n=1 Tax=Talaromyces atroroseus TaxID=1441469 RepID=A0A225B4J7_TALAT|nr:hypothetical protein UA08_03300 [Talaromyces atroroseus]OKL60857.1 hypothetical protein UA08_03300 [Talaromyces atroroseus]
MDTITTLFRRACDESDPNSDACAKPTSTVLEDAVPAAVVGVFLIVTGVTIFILARRRRRQFKADEDKERESFEIDIYEPTNSRYQAPSFPDPFNETHELSRDPDYNEFSLAPPYPGREHSSNKSFVSTDSGHTSSPSEAPAPPAYRSEAPVVKEISNVEDAGSRKAFEDNELLAGAVYTHSPMSTIPASQFGPPVKSLQPEMRAAEPYWLQRQMSRHIEQSDSEENNTTGSTSGDSKQTEVSRLSPKSRSLSDAAKHTLLQPSGSREFPPSTKDDMSLTNSPITPQKTQTRYSTLQNLSLQVPRHTPVPSTPGSSAPINRVPLSPKLDAAQIYGSPASAIPRRSRGLDFSRACTNLHHSTLAESSPDSSPNVGGRGVNIPQRRGVNTSTFGSPGSSLAHQSGSVPANLTTMSSSLSSVNMLESDTSSSDDDDDEEQMNADRDEMMITTTPQASKASNVLLSNPFGGAVPSPGNDWMGGYSPAAASLLSFQRARFRKSRNSRHSSSSASGNSNKPSPGPLSPPAMKSIEASNGGYFAREMSRSVLQSRRESLSLGTGDLQLSDMSDDGENRPPRGDSPGGSAENGPRGVVRRAVTRRGNLLPKPKMFSRVRAALMEESTPLDSEAKREAEVIRQVRESDSTVETQTPGFPLEKLEELTSTTSVSETSTRSAPETNFSNQASLNSGGAKFWDTFDGRYRTPPPAGRLSTQSSIVGEDMTMETPQSAVGRDVDWRSPAPQAVNQVLASELSRKRRRDDGFDAESFKRRAVSPGMSVQSSPVLSQASAVKDSSAWVIPPKTAAALLSEQTSSVATPTGLKRIGLQGMNETNDGLMNMSIDMSSTVEIASSFIEGAPPGELSDVVADIKALTADGQDIIPDLEPAFKSYNEKQLATVKLPGSSQEVIVSEFNRLDGDRYYDVESSTSFEFDHITQTASAAQSYPLDSQNGDLVKSLLRSLSAHATEHYPNSAYGVYPIENDTAVAIVLVANRYSPSNFWNGRYRAIYQVPVSSSSATITGNIHVDVHYYEDGNVALSTTKPVSIPLSSISAEAIMSKIGTAERDHQEELNRAFSRLAEGAFKSLRRQLPITRQKVEWERVGGYRLGQDISGGKGR